MAAARPKPYAAGALAAGPGIYRGFTLRETAGAAAVVRLWDGASAVGTLLETVALPTAGSARFDYGDDGVFFAVGVFAETVSGTVEGSVLLG